MQVRKKIKMFKVAVVQVGGQGRLKRVESLLFD